MTADRTITIRNSIAEIRRLYDELDRMISPLQKDLAEKDRALQTLLKLREILPDYERLMELELAGPVKASSG